MLAKDVAIYKVLRYTNPVDMMALRQNFDIGAF